MTTKPHSKRKAKANPHTHSQLHSKSPSPLSTNPLPPKPSDENFIEELFSKNYSSTAHPRRPHFFVEKLIEGLVSRESTMLARKAGEHSPQLNCSDLNK
jgi:hypothetical protein